MYHSKSKFMKLNSLLYLGALSTTLLLSSCDADFVDTTPTSSVSDETIFSSADNLMAAINGMHRNMYVRQNSSQGNNGFTAQMITYDVMGEDVIFPSTGNGWFVSELRWLHTNNENAGSNQYIWNFWYSMIKNANFIIQQAPNVPLPDDTAIEYQQSALGQAYAYRAFGMYQLVQTFGKSYDPSTASSDLGIVIRLDPTDNAPKARATVQEVYDQIIDDLAQAESILDNVDVYNNSHLSVNVVKGIQARVALTMKDYPLAADKALEARTGYALMSNADYLSGFNNYSNVEWMWGAKIIADQSDYFGNFMAYMSRNYSSSQIRSCPKVVNKNLFDYMDNPDVRKDVIKANGIHSDLGLPSNFTNFNYTSQKFLAQSVTVSLGDVPFMRAAEMYLIEAEASYYFDAARAQSALETLLRNRKNDNTLTVTTTGQALLDEILINRRIELWGEGFRFHDLKRLGQGLTRSTVPNQVSTVLSGGVTDVAPTDNRWQWLIPRQEINANPLIVQNPI